MINTSYQGSRRVDTSLSSLAEDRMRTPFESFWELAEAGPVGIESRQGAHTLRTAQNRSWRNQGGGTRLNLTRKHQPLDAEQAGDTT